MPGEAAGAHAGRLSCYQIVPILEKMVEESSKHKITAIECWEENLYVGTTTGYVVRYLLEQGESPTGKLTCRTAKQGQTHVCQSGRDRKIEKLMAVPAHRKLLAMYNGSVAVLDMNSLRTVDDKYAVTKSVFELCRDAAADIRSHNFNITAARKKGLYQFEVNNIMSPQKGARDLEDDRFRDVVSMARDGNTCCIAQRGPSVGGKGVYSVVNLRSGDATSLFEFPDKTIPLVKYVSHNEFLLVQSLEGTPTMGMFVNGLASSTRQQVEFPFRPIAAACGYPYLVALGENGEVTVHSLLDQKEKQRLFFRDGRILCDTGGRFILASDNRISLLAPVSFQQQIDELLMEHRVEEALQLADVQYNHINVDLDADEFARQREGMLALQRRAGLTYLKMNRFADGFDLLAASNADPREMIALFPGLLPRSSSYNPSVSTTGILDIGQVVKTKEDRRNAQRALTTFLEVVRTDLVQKAWAKDIDTALAVLYSTHFPDKLPPFVAKSAVLSVDDIKLHFEKAEQHHMLAILHARDGNARAALNIWRRINVGELADASFPGLSHAVDYLSSVTDVDLVYMHAGWMLERDSSAVRVFTRHDLLSKTGEVLFRPDLVLDFLNQYEAAVLPYLEYLVFDVRKPSERYHTHLALKYLDSVDDARLALKKALAADADVGEAATAVPAERRKLQRLLRQSDAYRVDTLMERIRRTDLFVERAILHGKRGEHHYALDLLVNRLGDHEAAEEYCVDVSRSKAREEGQEVFLHLLDVYLKPGPGGEVNAAQAMQLLNSHCATLDADKVLARVPLHWSIGVIDRFLRRSIRSTMHAQRAKRIEHGLARQENLQARAELVQLEARYVVVSESRRCHGCHRYFEDTDKVRVDVHGRAFIADCDCGKKKKRQQPRGGATFDV
mmetsp:Transcript_25377/g.76453  ORF Transcript_25377/g.76453 Transcript_25377/m.76453 type:complete len:901 (+) Transcript_25377:89-2791(+)